jgi:hypothetical protein
MTGWMDECMMGQMDENTWPQVYPPEMHLLEKRRVKVGINWCLTFHKYLA